MEISRFVDKSKEYLAKGDTVQASEKLYKAVEECIKVLAERYKLPEYKKAKRERRWSSYLLGQAAGRMAENLKQEKIEDVWARAFNIHIWGFHEGKYGVEEIRRNIPYVEWLVNFVKDQEERKTKEG